MRHTKDEALKLLDALKVKYSDVIYDVSPHLAAKFEDGIAGIEQALAAPVQEPTFTYDQVKAHIHAALLSAAPEKGQP